MQQEQLVRLFRQEFERCKLRPDETAIVLTGERSPAAYAQAALAAIRSLGASGFQMTMPPPVAPPGAKEGTYVGLTAVTGQRLAIETLKKADFVVDLVLLLHSPEQVEILNAGTRMLLVVEPPEILERMSPTDDMRRKVEQGGEILKRARTLQLTSPAGTNVEMKLGQYPVITQYGFTDQPGRWDHWPSSFLYTWPNEGGTNGTVVLGKGDFIWPLNRYVESAVKLTIREGYIRSIDGGEDARALKAAMDSFNDPEAFAVSHIGWGVDKRADWYALQKHPDAVGIDPLKTHILVVKSTNHFVSGFGPVAKQILYSDGPGALAGDPRRITYTKRKKPMWPFEADPWSTK